MELGFKETIEAVTLVSGWVAAFTTVRVKTNHIIESLKRTEHGHREAVQQIETTLRRENEMLNERVDEKKRAFDEFKKKVDNDMERLWAMSHRFIEAAEAEKRFVLKSELKLMIEKVDLQYKHLDEKLDSLIAAIAERSKSE